MFQPPQIPLKYALVVCASLIAVPGSAQDAGPSMADIVEAWLASPHGDRSSESFTHWNEDGEIPGTCAACHSSDGAVDYLRSPMAQPAVIDHAVAPGTSVDCAVCHNSAATTLTSVPFPSGIAINSFGTSAICATCHQGRASGLSVAQATTAMEDDVISGDLSFINVHYATSAGTILGSGSQIGFEYPDKVYRGQFNHVPPLSTCVDCHSPHSLEVKIENCTTCHAGAQSFTDIRISPTDFDGDGDATEGIANPIAELHARLDQAIRAYAAEVIGSPIVYAPSSYPYFFNDTDADGVAGPGEAIFPNRFASWTPRLLKAAYNYQLVAKEGAIYTHNPHYGLQLMYDSLQSLSESVAVDMSGLNRPS